MDEPEDIGMKSAITYSVKHPHSIVLTIGIQPRIYTTKHRVYYIYRVIDSAADALEMIPNAIEYFKLYFGSDFDEARIKMAKVPMTISELEFEIKKLENMESYIKQNTEQITVSELINHPYYSIWQIQQEMKPIQTEASLANLLTSCAILRPSD
jgi:hypothetical protein